MNDTTDLNTNHDDVNVMRILLQSVKGLSWTSSSAPALASNDDEE